MGLKPGEGYLRILRDRRRGADIVEDGLALSTNGRNGDTFFVPTVLQGLPSALERARRMKEKARQVLLKKKAETARQARREEPAIPSTSGKRFKPSTTSQPLASARGFDFAAAITSPRDRRGTEQPEFSPNINLDDILKDIVATADKYSRKVNESGATGWMGIVSPAAQKRRAPVALPDFDSLFQNPIRVLVLEDDEGMDEESPEKTEDAESCSEKDDEDMVEESPEKTEDAECCLKKEPISVSVLEEQPVPVLEEPAEVAEEIKRNYPWCSSPSWFPKPVGVDLLLTENDWSDDAVELAIVPEVSSKFESREGSPEIVDLEEDVVEDPTASDNEVENSAMEEMMGEESEDAEESAVADEVLLTSEDVLEESLVRDGGLHAGEELEVISIAAEEEYDFDRLFVIHKPIVVDLGL